MSDSLWPHGLQPARLLCPWDYPSKNSRVGCHALLQGIFPTQGSFPAFPVLAGRFFTAETPGKPSLTLNSKQKFFPEASWRTRVMQTGSYTAVFLEQLQSNQTPPPSWAPVTPQFRGLAPIHKPHLEQHSSTPAPSGRISRCWPQCISEKHFCRAPEQ